MRIVLSNHARMRAEMRGVSFEQIVDCITNPDQIDNEPDNKICYKRLLNQDKSLLLCYTVDNDGTITVVTVIKSSKISKYLK